MGRREFGEWTPVLVASRDGAEPEACALLDEVRRDYPRPTMFSTEYPLLPGGAPLKSDTTQQGLGIRPK